MDLLKKEYNLQLIKKIDQKKMEHIDKKGS